MQDAFLRYHASPPVEVESPKAYLSTIVTRLAIDHLRSARARRETYPGEWLPEPIVADEAAEHAETADSLSLAFLHLLEKLSPVERAVFLLREVFDYPYEEVGRIVGKSPTNCRQILARAHRHVEEGRRRFDVSREEREEVARRFLAAWEDGDVAALERVLARRRHGVRRRRRQGPVDAGAAGRRRARGEGPGRLAPQGRRARLRATGRPWSTASPGCVFHDADGRVAWVASLQIADGVVVAVRSILNPDKLAHVPPVGLSRCGRQNGAVPIVDNAIYVDGRRSADPSTLEETYELLRAAARRGLDRAVPADRGGVRLGGPGVRPAPAGGRGRDHRAPAAEARALLLHPVRGAAGGELRRRHRGGALQRAARLRRAASSCSPSATARRPSSARCAPAWRPTPSCSARARSRSCTRSSTGSSTTTCRWSPGSRTTSTRSRPRSSAATRASPSGSTSCCAR